MQWVPHVKNKSWLCLLADRFSLSQTVLELVARLWQFFKPWPSFLGDIISDSESLFHGYDGLKYFTRNVMESDSPPPITKVHH